MKTLQEAQNNLSPFNQDNEWDQSLIPITIITGFLGSGKTTLLNHILSNQKEIKIAVLVNEFGEIGIDNDLIVSTAEDMVELSNGCICCSINGELLEAVNKLLSRKDSIDYIILETTGLADPLPVAMTFLGSELRDKVRVDSILTVVDAENLKLEKNESEITVSQIKYADILLLNKCDLVNEDRLIEVECKLNQLKTDARIIRSVNGDVILPLIISIGLFDTAGFSKKRRHEHDHEHEHEHSIEGFTSFSFQSKSPLSLRRFQNFLDNQLPGNIFRAKGILWFKESNRKYIFHLAGKRFSLDDSDWNSERKNKIVFIGKGLESSILESQLKDCVLDQSHDDTN